MAKKVTEEKKYKEKGIEGVGTFTESTGGGTPIPKGEKLSQHPEAKRVMQPRDENGQFTYNAVNKRKLKYGPSRGKTTPPYLKTKKDEVKESGKYAIGGKIYNIDTYTPSEKIYTYLSKDFTADAKEYIGEELYEDYGEEERVSQSGNTYNLVLSKLKEGKNISPDFEKISEEQIATEASSAKPGKRSKVEKAAIVSEYKGDLNKLEFMGSGEELERAWADYSTSRKLEPGISKTLRPKSDKPRTIKPKKANNTQSFSEEDKNLLKTDPRAFQAKYSKEFGEIASMAKQAGKKINVNNLMKVLSSGNISSFDEFKTLLKKKLNIK